MTVSFPGFLQERDKVMPLIIQGFKDASEEAGTSVTGGQTVLNPWVVMGGVATTVCQPNEFIMWEWAPAPLWLLLLLGLAQLSGLGRNALVQGQSLRASIAVDSLLAVVNQ